MYTPSPNRRGFTMVELMVTISLIIILLAAALIGIRNTQMTSRDSKRLGDILTIAQAVDTYTTANRGTYPASSDGCARLPNNTGALVGKIEQYLPNNSIPLPPSPSTSSPYCYWYAYNVAVKDPTNPTITIGHYRYTLDITLERAIADEQATQFTWTSGKKYFYPGPFTKP